MTAKNGGITLPGKPDLVFPKYKAVVFIHGCFWHQHTCPDGHKPKSKKEYWDEKLKGNLRRDKQVVRDLKNLGWRVIVVWECEITNHLVKTIKRVELFLNR